MADDNNSGAKKPGEKEPGKFHYNPGNQSGKVAEIYTPEEERVNNRDRIEKDEKTHSR
jgi:hypothetical protein